MDAAKMKNESTVNFYSAKVSNEFNRIFTALIDALDDVQNQVKALSDKVASLESKANKPTA